MPFEDLARQQFTNLTRTGGRHVTVVLAAVLCTLVIGSMWRSCSTIHIDDIVGEVPAHPDMAQHSHEFDVPQVYKVIDGIYVAVGYAIANSILIEGPEGLIIVDTTESKMAAREIFNEFRKVSPHKPVKAIVYTHNHFDHCLGTEVFLENATGPVDIWGHYTLKDRVMEVLLTAPRVSWGSRHQFGIKLGKHLVNAGIGPRLRIDDGGSILPLFPNKFVVKDIQHEQIAGLNVTFVHIPGETPDQIGVWLPDIRVLLPADDIYTTFPNLYAIRGTPPRDTTEWFRSLDTMRSLGAEHLVPSHTRPVSGADRIDELLRVYSAAIEYVHDQTVRLFNGRSHPDEIAETIELPPDLAEHRYLQEFYGTAEWSARGVYERYLGWFGGDPVDLRPLGVQERARRYVELAGGATKTMSAAESALSAGEYQWALELATHLYRATGVRKRGGRWEGGRAWGSARDVKARALRGLAEMERNPIARNYYLTSITEDFVDSPPPTIEQRRAIQEAPARMLFDLMKVKLIPEKVIGVNWTIVFQFTDTQEMFLLRLRHCVLRVEEVKSFDGPFNAGMNTTLETWKLILTGERNPLMAYLNGDITLTGDWWTLWTFLSSFDNS